MKCALTASDKQDKPLLKELSIMQVDKIEGDDVYCTANNHANLDGLVTIFHTERSSDTLNNVQNDLPIMTEEDKSNIKDLSLEFEVDFISLSFTRSGEDIQSAREFLDSINMTTTKVMPQFPCLHMLVLVAKHNKMRCNGSRCRLYKALPS